MINLAIIFHGLLINQWLKSSECFVLHVSIAFRQNAIKPVQSQRLTIMASLNIYFVDSFPP